MTTDFLGGMLTDFGVAMLVVTGSAMGLVAVVWGLATLVWWLRRKLRPRWWDTGRNDD